MNAAIKFHEKLNRASNIMGRVFNHIQPSLLHSVFFISIFIKSIKICNAQYGMHGDKVISTTNNIVNEYTTLTADASASSTSITVASSSLNANSRFSGNLVAGELVMIIQIQGATISTINDATYGTVSSYGNAGRFEFAEVASVPNSTTINLTVGLKRSYTASGKVQVIRVPRYSSFTVTAAGSVTSPAWNGSTGGIVAIESNGTSVIDGSIDVSAKGFRGGANEQSTSTPGNHTTYRSSNASDGAEKGESIAGTASSLANGQYGRGAPANGGGGGNSHNAGGGGGANAGTGTWNGGGVPDISNSNYISAWDLEGGTFSSNNSPGGGRGGYSWSSSYQNPITLAPGNSSWAGDSRFNVGGLGGRVLNNSTQRIYFGGGGGAGDSNNNVGTPGGKGGGIIFLLSGDDVSGTGTISANGESVALSTGVPGDACGGGGGGGTIIIYTNGANVIGLTLTANGGNGGSQSLNNGAEVEGPGGGGGAGYISTATNVGLTRTALGGLNGTTNAPAMVSFPMNGATRGGRGSTITGSSNPYSGSNTLPVTLVNFNAKITESGIELRWITASEINNDYFTLESGSNGKSFTILTRVKGSGTASTEQRYIYVDNKKADNTIYYRLKQTDFDGKTVSLKTIAVTPPYNPEQNRISLSVFPNPVGKTLKFSVYTPSSEKMLVSILHDDGCLIMAYQQFFEPGTHELEIKELEKISRGKYILSLQPEMNKKLTAQFLKQ